jgi:hypothetical protein
MLTIFCLWAAFSAAHADGFVITATPKTLNEAIRQALHNYQASPPADRGITLDVVIEEAVGDFVAQKISIQTMKHQSCEDLLLQTYTLIRGRKPGGLK